MNEAFVDSITWGQGGRDHQAIQQILCHGDPAELKIHSFLMVGQSNMAGRGPLKDAPLLLDDRCFMLRIGRWRTMLEPVNPDRSPYEGFGAQSGGSPAARFAKDYAEKFDQNVGLIPCADGGTTIDEWQPGGLLFDNAVMQAQLAMRKSELAGILWHQGESDCLCMETVTAYPEKFFRVMEAFRRELGPVPIVTGELGRSEFGFFADRKPYLDAFNAQLHQLAAQLPDCGVASSEGLFCKGDGYHFDLASTRELGHRYFAEYCRLTGK